MLPQAGTYVIAAMPVITPAAASAGPCLDSCQNRQQATATGGLRLALRAHWASSVFAVKAVGLRCGTIETGCTRNGGASRSMHAGEATATATAISPAPGVPDGSSRTWWRASAVCRTASLSCDRAGRRLTRGTFVSYRLPGRIVCLERVCAARHPAAPPAQVGWCHGLSMSMRDGDRGQRRGRAVSGAAAAGARLARAGVAPAGRPAFRRGENRHRGRHPARDRRAGRAGEGVAGL